MRNLNRVLFSCIIFFSCSNLFAQSLVEQTKDLIENNQYAQVKVLISSVAPTHPEYNQLQTVLVSIKPALDEFVQQAIAEANLYYLNLDTDYGEAILVITNALLVLPNDADLLETYEVIKNARDDEAQKIRQEILVNKGHYLIAVSQSEKSVVDLYPDEETVALKYAAFLQEKKEVAMQLSVQAKVLLDDGIQLAVAYDLALLAFQLDPSDESELVYSLVNNRMKARTADIKAEESKQILARNEVEINYWLDQFSVDLTNNNITEANQAIKELESFGLDTTEHKLRVERTIEQMVMRALERGNTLWSEGRIEEALDKWLEVQQYGRDNRKLNNNISKAQSFIAYYNEVKKQNQ